ncbi:MAG: class I SAM-dependent methyltransferase [Bacillota bacterium]
MKLFPPGETVYYTVEVSDAAGNVVSSGVVEGEAWGDKVLDLACGKGAVSVKLAQAFGCRVHGIDAVKAFIEEANRWAKKYNVESKGRGLPCLRNTGCLSGMPEKWTSLAMQVSTLW